MTIGTSRDVTGRIGLMRGLVDTPIRAAQRSRTLETKPQLGTRMRGEAFKYRWQNGLGLELTMQHERRVAPLLASGPQSNFTTQVQLSFWPKDWKLQKH